MSLHKREIKPSWVMLTNVSSKRKSMDAKVIIVMFHRDEKLACRDEKLATVRVDTSWLWVITNMFAQSCSLLIGRFCASPRWETARSPHAGFVECGKRDAISFRHVSKKGAGLRDPCTSPALGMGLRTGSKQNNLDVAPLGLQHR